MRFFLISVYLKKILLSLISKKSKYNIKGGADMPAVRKPTHVQREERIVIALKTGLLNKGWSVQHFADLCGMKAGNMSRTINHPMSVKLETILVIASKLGIDSIPT